MSTDCPSGPSEVLDAGRYGQLVPVGDTDALARAIGDGLDAKRDAERSRRRALHFSADQTIQRYLEALLPDERRD